MPGNNKTVSGSQENNSVETGSAQLPADLAVPGNADAPMNSGISPSAPESRLEAPRGEDTVPVRFPDERFVDVGEAVHMNPGVLFKGTDNNLFPKESEKKRDNYLLLIAIDRYRDSKQNLTNPVRDANALLEVLLNNYGFYPEIEDQNKDPFSTIKEADSNGQTFYYKVFNNNRIICLYNEDAKLKNIGNAVDKLISNMKVDSQLLIYFSGHGFRNKKKNEEFTLTTYDYEAGDITSYLPVDFLTDKGDTTTCRNLLLIVDACYSGSATFGNKHETDRPFSREVLTSCGHAQLASDGKPYEGSPFSLTLVDILKNNGKRNKIELVTLTSEINDYLEKSNEGNKQRVSHGKAPASENGSETFLFQLEDTVRPPVKLFAESLINHLNFDEERTYFDDDDVVDPQNYSKDYLIISSESVDSSIEKFRGGIISKTVAMKLRKEEDFKLKKYPIHFRLNMNDLKSADHIFHFLSHQKNFEGVGIEKNKAITSHSAQDRIDYISGLMGANLAKFEDCDNPLCVSFILENFKPSTECEIISEFIFMMIVGIEQFKSKNKQTPKWEKLVVFIVSDLGGEIQDTRGFSEDRGHCLTQLFKKASYSEPIFKWFNKVGPIGYNHVDRWLRSTGDSISASAYKELRQKHKAGSIKSEHFPNKEMITIGKCLNLLCKEVKFTESQSLELFEIMLFKK